MNAVAHSRVSRLMESVIAQGDLAKLSPEDRGRFYMEVCRSVGLNPLTRPFEYLTLNGQMILYARRDCADQLRKKNGISIEIVDRSLSNGLLTVHVRARDGSGRTDEDLGVVNVAALEGEAAANAALKAVTKAKRRVTLSISGLGFLDETEVEDIRGSRPPTRARNSASPNLLSTAAPCKIQAARKKPKKVLAPHSILLSQIGDKPNHLLWAQKLLRFIEPASTVGEVTAWQTANWDTLQAIKSVAPKLYQRTCARIAEVRRVLSDTANNTDPIAPPAVCSPSSVANNVSQVKDEGSSSLGKENA